MKRYRANAFTTKDTVASDAYVTKQDEPTLTKSLVFRVSNPNWLPKNIAGLDIQSRLGTIVTARGSVASVHELLRDPMVISIEESRPVGKVECAKSMPFIKVGKDAQYINASGPYEETGDGALIAIIDNGIDILHEAFLDASGKSRIVGIWDQTSKVGNPPSGFNYGEFHDEATILTYVQTKKDFPPALGRNEQGHGTHVASIAAGRAVGPFAGGVAEGAKLLIVVSSTNSPIGYSQSHIDALVFIDEFATKLKLPVVVNVSEGMNAGAHDGKSPLEVAFDYFSISGTKPGRVVVKSAGNERQKKGHAKITVKTGALVPLQWRRQPGADYAERIELWWNGADEMAFRLRQPVPVGTPPPNPDPPENWTPWVKTNAPEYRGRFAVGGPVRLVLTTLHVDNGDNQLLIELGDATGVSATGDWLLEINGVAIREGGEMHGWIERSGGVATSFLNLTEEEMTLSIPGTAESVITVSAIDASTPIRVGDFSSYGPTRKGTKKPVICAPGVNVVAACGGTANDVITKSGTSMSAPHVTGAIALLLSRTTKRSKALSANQIMTVLRQKAQFYDGSWERAQGYGIVDVTALLAAFD